jgi:hypothetical protein
MTAAQGAETRGPGTRTGMMSGPGQREGQDQDHKNWDRPTTQGWGWGQRG